VDMEQEVHESVEGARGVGAEGAGGAKRQCFGGIFKL